MLGDSARIWSKQEDTVLQWEKIFSYYLRERDHIGGGCKTANLISRVTASQEDYSKLIELCEERTGKLSKKIG